MFDAKRVSDRLMMIKMIVGEVVVTVLSVYVPQFGLTIAKKGVILQQPTKPCPNYR